MLFRSNLQQIERSGDKSMKQLASEISHFQKTSGRSIESLGEVVHVDMKEHVAHWHMTHSYVRGKFRNRAIAAPILLAKSF